ncbi:hypothetical protein CYMTET_45371 [Cymbomonas tetramitiformis]|uniref:Uncharacterized protein n=1 Tax=Cymbomonas tetramitiformis TaxID=36881 RepID=A0AAE0BYC3_9CHLO|nr:hypothetical protein CYMTET_45371 [Cymbomonas tetramitiformis]|eukprot:gene25624-31331_t
MIFFPAFFFISVHVAAAVPVKSDHVLELLTRRMDEHLAGRWSEQVDEPGIPPELLLEGEQDLLQLNGSAAIGLDCDKTVPKMFVSPMSHGCGCRSSSFRPSNPRWTSSVRRDTPTTVYLLNMLNTKNLCFVGDSVNMGIRDGLVHNIKRLTFTHPHLGVEVTEQRWSIPINDTTQPGGNRGWWGGMKDIPSWNVHLNSSNVTVRITYFKHYVWSPWDVEFIFKEECDVILMNLGLHYTAGGNFMGRNNHPLYEDTLAAAHFLSNFSEDPNRISVFYSTLPQHFEGKTGHYNRSGSQCTALGPEVLAEQGYNNVSRSAFRSVCRGEAATRDGRPLLYRCTEFGNYTASTKYQSVPSWWEINNYTGRLQAQARQGSDWNEPGGYVYYLPVFDLFDVHKWHNGDKDCSHFCFIPTLFEAFYDRLIFVLESNPLESKSHRYTFKPPGE